MITQNLFTVLALMPGFLTSVIAQEPPTYVNHDALDPVMPTLGQYASVIRAHEPYLHIAHGCQPYTAVNDNNEISGGLQDTGTVTGGCSDTSKGQTYVRTMHLNDKFGIMYAWYWPKDQPTDGDVVGGHRHDWEACIVWLDSSSPTARIDGGACSGHGEWDKTTNPNRNGRRVKVEYFVSWPYNHAMQFTDTQGRGYYMYDWDAMPDITKSALNLGDFGDANVPFNDNNFERNMEEAFP